MSGRELRPRGGRLGAERDLEEALEQPGVVDARADALVVLRVAHDQPARTARRPRSVGATTAKSGFTSVAPLVLEADERDGEPVDHRRRPLGDRAAVGVGEQLARSGRR